MPTKTQLVSDIILRITQGKPSDDLELEPKQVAFWIDMVLPDLMKETLDQKLISKGGFIDPSYICWEKDIALNVKQLAGTRSDFYIDLCHEPINLYRDRAVVRVSTADGDWVDKMKMEEIDNLQMLRFSKPSLKNIKYTRVKKRLYFFGVTTNTYFLPTFDIAYVPSPSLLDDMADDDNVFIGEDILPRLAEEVEKIARRQVYQSDIDEENNAQQALNVNGQ